MAGKKTFRLDRLLGSRGYCARSQADDFLAAATVCVNGHRFHDAAMHADPAAVTINGEPLDPEFLFILLHKPLGTVCSHEADEPSPIYDLVPRRYRFRSPPLTSAGRLDKDTSGLLILSDDGVLIHKLTSPKKHVPKVYEVTLRDPLRGDEAAKFASGTFKLIDDDKPLLPAELEAVGPAQARLTLHEGRYHQVRRMFEATGNLVTELHRSRVGNLTLGDLPAGQWRHLSSGEIQAALGIA